MSDPGARALWYVGPRRAEIRDTALDAMTEGSVEVETLYTALSRGTERLVWEGRVPASEFERMRAPMQDGRFPFPVKYGYCAVGRVVDGAEALLGRDVFALHPHQSRFRVPADAVVAVPEGVPSRRAVLAANMETALNALWDAELRPGARVAVIGLGLVGLSIVALLSRRSDITLSTADILASRGDIASDFNVSFCNPVDLTPDYDVIFHTSSSSEGLAAALDALAFEGTVIELSWYGDRSVPVALGAAFHARRLTIKASQVGHVAPARRATTSYRARLEQAIARLDDPRLDALLTETVAFDALPATLERLLAPGTDGIATVVSYQ